MYCDFCYIYVRTACVLQDTLNQLMNELKLFYVLSVIDNYDDIQAKKTLAYLPTSSPITDFIKERISLQESWKDFSDVLTSRYGVLNTPVDAWHTLISIRQVVGEYTVCG